MMHVFWLFGCLTICGAVLRGYFEHMTLKLCRVPVEDRSYLQRSELFGHVEHKPVKSFGKSLCICFLPGLLECLVGALIALPAVLQLFYMGVMPRNIVDGRVSVMFIVCTVVLYFAVSLFCHAFPTYEDALYLWESRKQTNIAVRILLFVPMVCIRAGAFLARFGFWQLLAIAGTVVWILYLVGVI